MEKWTPFKYNSNYKISNFGNVKRLKHRHHSKCNKLLAFRPGGYKKRYLRVSIMYKDYYVHRLVLEHFSGNPPEGYQCAHLDGNPHNNNILNLKWVLPKENSQHKIIHGTNGAGQKNAMAKISDKEAIEIVKLYSKGISSKELQEKFKLTRSSINGIAIGNIRFSEKLKKIYIKNKKIAKKWIGKSNDRRKTSSR